MTTTSSSLSEPHFASPREAFNPLQHRPHKTFFFYLKALAATAAFRIWPVLLFMAGWASMVISVTKYTAANLAIPNTMITVLGVLLGLTLSYRTSSAYEKYSEGRRMWSAIILVSRTWARAVWIHCPDTVLSEPATDPQEKARDFARGVIEKKTMVQLALGFAVAVKHYLRYEEGIHYEDLYPLVNFIPALDLPSGLPSETDTHIAAGLPSFGAVGAYAGSGSSAASTHEKTYTHGPKLAPANAPPHFEWDNLLPQRLFGKKTKKAQKEELRTCAHGVGHNVPLEITMFMSSWVNTMQHRKTIDVPTINVLLAAIASMNDSLVNLERILTTPIPWSYNAHIWQVSWIYCMALPFQLVSGFGWITVPAVLITAYIVMGYASIAGEIENPFGYDPNDLNLGYFCQEVIAKELDATTARPFPDPAQWIFSSSNQILGPNMPAADRLADMSVQEIRARLASAPGYFSPQHV